MQRDALEGTLDELIVGHDLQGGAEMVVDDPDGTEVFRAALARSWRIDDDRTTLWIRPVVGGYHEPGLGDMFDLSEARPRSASLHGVTVGAGGGLHLELATGQRAWIRPIGADLLPDLERWDTFVLNSVSADVEADLERLIG
jgi:hypothetical protein